MLVLSRIIGDEIIIGDAIRIAVIDIRPGRDGGKVRLGIDAPREVAIDRAEVREAKRRRPGGDKP